MSFFVVDYFLLYRVQQLVVSRMLFCEALLSDRSLINSLILLGLWIRPFEKISLKFSSSLKLFSLMSRFRCAGVFKSACLLGMILKCCEAKSFQRIRDFGDTEIYALASDVGVALTTEHM